MKILALETSAKAVSAALVQDGVPVASSFQNIGLTHSVTLMPLIDSMLKNAGVDKKELELIAVANGPGSFTGLRIGVSAAKGLAWALDLPCSGISTLEAMAQNARNFEGMIICAMDARRNQIYNAVFNCHNGQLTRVCDDRAIGLDDLLSEIQSNTDVKLVIGDGASLCSKYLLEHDVLCRIADSSCVLQNAVGVGIAAEEAAQRRDTVSCHQLVPTYLRLSQAERERLAKGLSITVD